MNEKLRGIKIKNNKGLTISIIILACTIMISSSMVAIKLPTTINLPFTETKENSQVLQINEAADYRGCKIKCVNS